MPVLAGQPFYDASGNAMTDASNVAIGEPDLPISLNGGFLVQAGVLALGGTFWSTLAEAIISGVVDSILGSGGNDNTDLREQMDLIRFDLEGVDQGEVTIRDQVDYIRNQFPLDMSGVEVTWPTEAPTWYTAPDPLDTALIASDVWGYTEPFFNLEYNDTEQTMKDQLLSIAYAMQGLMGYDGIPVPDRPYFRAVSRSNYETAWAVGMWTNLAPTEYLPELDLSLAQEGDTVWDYLQREYPEYTWLHTGPGNWPIGGQIWLQAGSTALWFRCTLTDADLITAQLPAIVNNVTVDVAVDTAPVWPGNAEVTLGTPVALSDGMYISEAMDGIIVAVTTPPTKVGRYSIGGALYDYGVGRLAFETDAGDIEPFQYMGFRAAIYTPHTMKRAAGVRLQVLGGAEGTVTPWTKG